MINADSTKVAAWCVNRRMSEKWQVADECLAGGSSTTARPDDISRDISCRPTGEGGSKSRSRQPHLCDKDTSTSCHAQGQKHTLSVCLK
jgi:hypothetical protein